MKTLNLYKVSFNGVIAGEMSLLVAARTGAAAKRQTKEYYSSITKFTGVERLGNVNVPVNLPAGL